ncbi:MAG: ROK family protein [Ruminococcaceae bacterium]|nr:ROK family protein [Oscillospiraceae bacterium]
MMYHLGIDLGGTNIAVGVVDENFKIVGRGKKKTNCPRPADEICDDMAAAAKMAIEDAGLTIDDIDTIGVGAPGSINPFTGVIAISNNLRFENVHMGEMLKERLGRDVFLENDANAAAYGEFLAGAGVGTKDMVAVTLGTGVGGGIIIDGKLFSGSNLAGGELGHTVIVHGGEQCTCGRKGCWEAYASATGLINLTKKVMKANPDSKMWELCDGDINNANGRTSYDGMRAGDKAATEVVDTYEDYVACGITNVINIFQPEVVCIGGGISKEGDTLLKPIVSKVVHDRFTKNVEKQTMVKIAELGNDAGIIGAAFIHRLYR